MHPDMKQVYQELQALKAKQWKNRFKIALWKVYQNNGTKREDLDEKAREYFKDIFE